MYKTQLETAAALGVSQPTLQKWVADGCPHIVINPKATGRAIRRRFNVEQVRAWLEARTPSSTGKGVEA